MKNSPTGTKINNYSATPFLRKTVITFLSLALAASVCFTVLYVMYDVKSFKYLLYIFTMQHVLWLTGFIIYKDLSTESVIMMYISYITTALFPVACIYWNAGNPVVFSWYLLIMFGIVVFQMRNIGLWIFVISIIVISVFFLSPVFPKEDLSPALMNEANIMTVIATIVLAGFFAVVYVKRDNFYESTQEESLQSTPESTEISEKDKALYNEIINYLETNKPFKNPDFNAHTLAIALNTNVTYISKALSAGGNDNFNALLNNIRVNYVKSMLDNGALKKYTLDFIQAEAGYKHRSTFNTAFKSITGMTPSEYASQNSHDNT